jgi:hypothetical protein
MWGWFGFAKTVSMNILVQSNIFDLIYHTVLNIYILLIADIFVKHIRKDNSCFQMTSFGNGRRVGLKYVTLTAENIICRETLSAVFCRHAYDFFANGILSDVL